MKRELPNYIFKKKYDNFYLNTEFDIIFNVEFTDKINILMSKIASKNLIIELDVPTTYKGLVPEKIEISNLNSLNDFYEISKIVNDVDLFYYMFNFYLFDESNTWIVYVSLEKETSILACLNSVNLLFKSVIKPYEEENLDTKYKIISDSFRTIEEKESFIKVLENNFNFSKFV